MVVGVNNILDCLELNTPSNKRDIEDIIRNQRQNNNENSSSTQLYHLIIDVDTTLERLYGGFYPDWLAGGEWSHLYSYILSLLKTCQELSLCLVFCFDGTLYRYGQSQWYYEQIQQRKKVNQIFKHLKQNKSGLPRRHLWLSPPAFQLCLRTILREINSSYLIMYQTWGYGQCQHQEQIKIYARQYNQSLIGIVSSDIEFLFSTNINNKNILLKYFSSKNFKLSLKGKLTLVEIKLSQLKDKFSLDNKQFSLLLTLLGNHIISDSDLIHFHNDILRNQDLSTSSSKRILLKSNGTVSPPIVDSSMSETKTDVCSPDNNTLDTSEDHQQTSSVTSPVHFSTQSRLNGNYFSINSAVDQLIPRLVDYIRKQNVDNDNDIDFDLITNQVFKYLTDNETRKTKTQLLIDSYQYYLKAIIESQPVIESMESSETSFCSNFSSSQVSVNKSDENIILENCSGANIEVVRTAFNLHQQGLMMPWIFQCLYKHEITFPVTIEPEMCNTIPGVCEFFRPIRKYLYSILFDNNTIIREQVYNSEHGSYLTEIVCEQLLLKHTIEQLWFGTSPDEDRQIRMKTFLQSLYYCDLPKIYSISHDYLIFICILRYIYMEFFRYSSTSAILHTYELMAFISQAVLITELQPKPLMNIQSINFLNQYDHIQIINYETRPIQLAHLFMRGFETILFANEVCGAPIHPKYCCPSHFFNGKLFHQKYLQAQYYQQNQDLMIILCDGNAHFAQIGSHLLDIILDRTTNDNIHQTPIQQQQQQQQYQYPAVPQQQQQRILKNPSRQGRTQILVANSTRPPMRTNNKQSIANEFNNQQQTPISNYRQQQQLLLVKQTGHMKNTGTKKNNNVTPFNAKNHQQSMKFNTHIATNMNFPTLPQQHHPLSTDQWTAVTTSTIPSNHLHMQSQHQQTHSIHNIQPIPLQHQQPMNNNFINPLDEQFVHFQIHPPPIATTPAPIPYPHPTQIINPHIPMAQYNHLHPSPLPPPAYTIANGPTFYQPSPTSTNSFQQQPLTTPYHPHHPQMLPGVPPHAPIAPQRTVNFTTVMSTNNTNTNTYQQQSQRVSPTSMQAQELNIQALQQRIIEQQKHQQTPISIQRQMNRLHTNDYTQYDVHRSIANNGIPIAVQSCHHPSMIAEHQQRSHGP
ncbi:unnamed protein product [Rotaria sordida]|uniref:Uncharacterized protein n=1 Tax=Rotaria sordida TaxID=392033 RepID=A0A815FB69_9BILA|nr:unnamed protein product [Rotaria sordida]CAF1321108.1 unnamed protein product [Rotaria sordida]